MRRKNSRRNQKLYKMKGCSKSKSFKKYLGGSPSNINLAYPSSNVQTSPNPFLAYTGKNPYKGMGGSSNKYLTKEFHEKTPEGEVLDELGMRKMCCRRHFLTHVDIE